MIQMRLYITLLLISLAYALPSLNVLQSEDAQLIKSYIDAITAYGPGLGVHAPYQYVDISYDNIPMIGKIPVIGKEGTSSRLGISPFYPPQGNPSNPFPPIYKARPLPLHVPEPQDVVAVPLDEEALHGEPLFPPEMVLPGELGIEDNAKPAVKPIDPFEADENALVKQLVDWPDKVNTAHSSVKSVGDEDEEENNSIREGPKEIVIEDKIQEKNMKAEEAALKAGRGNGDAAAAGLPKNPFRSKRVQRMAVLSEILQGSPYY